MSKVFEDYFSELQADMVSIAVEYVENQAEQVFVYCSFRDRVIYGDVFYKINGKVCHTHKVNEALRPGQTPVDTDPDRQGVMLRIINKDIEALRKLCAEYKREMPAVIQIIYNAETNRLNASYKYGWQPDEDEDDMFRAWFAEEQAKAGH